MYVTISYYANGKNTCKYSVNVLSLDAANIDFETLLVISEMPHLKIRFVPPSQVFHCPCLFIPNQIAPFSNTPLYKCCRCILVYMIISFCKVCLKIILKLAYTKLCWLC